MTDADRWFRGYARVRVTGADPVSFLNRCAMEGIILRDVSREDDFTVHASCMLMDLAAAERLAKRCGCSWEVLRRRGMPEARKALRRRRAGAVLLALVCVGLLLSSLFVWEIRVTKNDSPVPDAKILRIISDCGVKPGSFWPAFRAERIRTDALLELPELRFLSVNVRGSRAFVEAYAAVPKPEIFEPDVPGDVTAVRSGIIESVRAFSGSPKTAAGNVVAPGQILIAGDSTSPHARGEVRAYTYYEITASAPLTRRIKESGGKTTRRFFLIIGENRIKISCGSGILPVYCDKMIREWDLRSENAIILPIRLEMETRIPYTIREEKADPELLRHELERKLADCLSRELSGRGEVLDARYSAAVVDGRLTVTIRGRCLERIDEDVPKS